MPKILRYPGRLPLVRLSGALTRAHRGSASHVNYHAVSHETVGSVYLVLPH